MKKILVCDCCGEIVHEGEIVKLCADGGIVHEQCVVKYAIQQLMPVSITIEDIIAAGV